MELSKLGISESGNPQGAASGEPSADELALEAFGTEADASGAEGTPAAEGSGEQVFYEPSGVPEGLKASWGEMQKAFTQKTQEVAALRKKLETDISQKSQESQAARYKAEVLDQMLRDPEIYAFLQRKAGTTPASPEESDLDPTVANVVTQHLAPVRQELLQLRAQMVDRQEAEDFAREHPDWKDHWDLMQDAWRQDRERNRPLRSREAAYDFAFRVKQMERIERAKQARAQQKVSVEGPGKQGPSPETLPSPKSVQEAAELALRLHPGFDPSQL